jgi:hypothetical protein
MISRRGASLGLTAAWVKPNLRVVRTEEAAQELAKPYRYVRRPSQQPRFDAFEREFKGAKRQS